MDSGNLERLWARRLEQAGCDLEQFEELGYIVSSFSSLFFSSYYIDLEHDTFRAITQLDRVGDVLGDEINCTEAMIMYANNFVHPDDRDRYLRTMSMANLSESLRWWNPCVAVEYRLLSGNPFAANEDSKKWVRASAVLARTGEDDLPQTAVYVAQDISSGREIRM